MLENHLKKLIEESKSLSLEEKLFLGTNLLTDVANNRNFSLAKELAKSSKNKYPPLRVGSPESATKFFEILGNNTKEQKQEQE